MLYFTLKISPFKRVVIKVKDRGKRDFLFVAHIQKMKATAVRGMQIHFERESENSANESIDRGRTKLNVDLSAWDHPGVSYTRRVKQIMSKCYKPTLTKEGKVKNIRADATMLCSVVISADNDFFKSLNEKKKKIYFDKAMEWLKEEYPHTVSAKVHYDETTPHLHYAFVPLTADGRLSAKEVVNRNALYRLQDRLPKFLEQNIGQEVRRGVRGSKTRHKDVLEFKEANAQGSYQNPLNGELNPIRAYSEMVKRKQAEKTKKFWERER